MHSDSRCEFGYSIIVCAGLETALNIAGFAGPALAPEDSNLYYRSQSPVSCHWTRGQHPLKLCATNISKRNEETSDFTAGCHIGLCSIGAGAGAERTRVEITSPAPAREPAAAFRSDSVS